VPAALYKLALSVSASARPTRRARCSKIFVKRFPNAGEAQLARERLGGRRR